MDRIAGRMARIRWRVDDVRWAHLGLPHIAGVYTAIFTSPNSSVILLVNREGVVRRSRYSAERVDSLPLAAGRGP